MSSPDVVIPYHRCPLVSCSAVHCRLVPYHCCHSSFIVLDFSAIAFHIHCSMSPLIASSSFAIHNWAISHCLLLITSAIIHPHVPSPALHPNSPPHSPPHSPPPTLHPTIGINADALLPVNNRGGNANNNNNNGRARIRGRGQFNIGLQGRGQWRAPRPPGQAPQPPALNRGGRPRNFPVIRAAPHNARPRWARQTQPDVVNGWASDWGAFVSSPVHFHLSIVIEGWANWWVD